MADSENAAVALGMGVLQGITEFLPISSDGHLATAAMLFTVPNASLALTVLLHVGTLLATALVFRPDLAAIARTSLAQVRTPRALLDTPEGRLLLNIVVASVPTAVIGLALESRVESLSQTRWVVGLGFLASAVAVLSTRGKVEGGERLSLRAALFIGAVQGLAVLPGVSRSALTIASGLALGLSAQAAFRFSFLLSLPAVAGAALLELGDPEVLRQFTALSWFAALTAFASGYAALLLLRGLLTRGRFWLFALYLVPLGAAMLAWDLFGS